MNLTIQSYDCNNNNHKISFQRLDHKITKLIKDVGKAKVDKYVNDYTELGCEIPDAELFIIMNDTNAVYNRIQRFVKKIHKDIVFTRIKNKEGQNTFVLTHKNGEPITFKNYNSKELSGFECTSTAREIELKQYRTIYHSADVTADKPSLRELRNFAITLKNIDPKLVNKTILQSMIDRAYKMVTTNSSPEAINEQLDVIYKFAKETDLEKGLKDEVEYALKVANEYREPVRNVKIDPVLARKNQEKAKEAIDSWQIGRLPKIYE